MVEHIRTKQIIENSRPVIDAETGELIEVPVTKTVSYVAGDKDSFYLVYSKLISLILEDELSLPDVKVFAYLLKTYGVGVPIVLSKAVKEIIVEELNLKMSTINNSISSISNLPTPLLFRKATSLYYLNPRFAIKGSSSERDTQMRVLFELGCKNC